MSKCLFLHLTHLRSKWLIIFSNEAVITSQWPTEYRGIEKTLGYVLCQLLSKPNVSTLAIMLAVYTMVKCSYCYGSVVEGLCTWGVRSIPAVNQFAFTYTIVSPKGLSSFHSF